MVKLCLKNSTKHTVWLMLSKQQKGIRAELLAAIDFLGKPNTHVYYDLGGKGPADLVVVNSATGTVDLYDV